MRITGRQLRQIIKEEVARMMNEEDIPGETITKDPVTGKLSSTATPKGGSALLSKYFAADRAAADKIKRDLEQNAMMNISLGADVAQPFTSETGAGKLLIKVPSAGLGVTPATATATVGAKPNITFKVLDASGGELQLSDDGYTLFRNIVGRLRRRIDATPRPRLTFEIELPVKWSPGKVIVGTGKGFSDMGGGTAFTADKIAGNISIMGIGFR